MSTEFDFNKDNFKNCPYDEQNNLHPIILFLGNEQDWDFWNYEDRFNNHGLVQLTNNKFDSGIRGLI